jgi:hypothetical protein
MAGSGNTLWRTREWSDKWPQEKKRTPKEHQRQLGTEELAPLISPTRNEEERAQIVHYHTRRYQEGRLRSRNEEIPVYTIAGPLAGDGKWDKGPNKIKNNVELALKLITEFVKDCQREDRDRPILIMIKAHSRGAVAADLLCEKVRSQFKDIPLALNLVLFDPVPGPSQPTRYLKDDEGLAVEESTLVYSVNSKKPVGLFTPQQVYGASRVIVSRKDHGVGYHIGFKFEGKLYRGNKLNRLLPGFYVSISMISESKPEIIVPCLDIEVAKKALNEMISWPDMEGRKPIITAVAEHWFNAHPPQRARSERPGFERKPRPSSPVPPLE